jgi:hypothetical protein
MGTRPNVVIVMAKCSHRKEYFGIRFERNDNIHSSLKFLDLRSKESWIGDWAFAIEEQSVIKEGYDKNQIRGFIGFSVSYPGCPHCNGKSIFQCGCGRVACWDGKTQIVTCPHCGMTAQLSGQIESLHSGFDR